MDLQTGSNQPAFVVADIEMSCMGYVAPSSSCSDVDVDVGVDVDVDASSSGTAAVVAWPCVVAATSWPSGRLSGAQWRWTWRMGLFDRMLGFVRPCRTDHSRTPAARLSCIRGCEGVAVSDLCRLRTSYLATTCRNPQPYWFARLGACWCCLGPLLAPTPIRTCFQFGLMRHNSIGDYRQVE